MKKRIAVSVILSVLLFLGVPVQAYAKVERNTTFTTMGQMQEMMGSEIGRAHV